MSEIAKHWIDGEWTGSGTVSESVNPAVPSKRQLSASCAARLRKDEFQDRPRPRSMPFRPFQV